MSPTRGLPGPDAERSSVRFGTKTIRYVIRRSPRRKTVSIAVHPGAGVVVTAPSETGTAKLDEVVHAKARWILEKLGRETGIQPGIPKREFVDGETFLYLGRQYRLKVVSGGDNAFVRLLRGRLTVSVPVPSAGPSGAVTQVRKAIVAWYRAKAAERLPERVVFWSERLGIEAGTVLVREQTQRWASCSEAGILRFNWRIIQAPMRLVDYVVAHELVHLEVKEHSAEFWKRLGVVMPDYDLRKEGLRARGRRFQW
ncbi:MAG: M48 family metallopeptidase [Thermoanaerobaculia bacterium]|nr:M48 family metallopeptidase [Thermoanaerobaculia bacterium]